MNIELSLEELATIELALEDAKDEGTDTHARGHSMGMTDEELAELEAQVEEIDKVLEKVQAAIAQLKGE